MQTGSKKKKTNTPAQDKDINEVTGRTAASVVRKEEYRLVGRRTFACQRAHVVDSSVGAPRKGQVLERAQVFNDFGLHKPPNLFQFARDLHFGYDVLLSCGPAPDLRTLLYMLRSQDKVLNKPKNRRRTSDMIHCLEDALLKDFEEGHADDEDARCRFYSLRLQLVRDGPDEAYITLHSPPNHKGERPLEKYYACQNGQIVDGAGIPYPPFRHHFDRTADDLLHPAGLVLEMGNKLMWKKENERYYAQKGPDEEYDSFAGLERGIRLSYEAMELLVQRFFTETEDPDETSEGKGPPPEPPLYAEIEAYLADAAVPNPSPSVLPVTTPPRPRRRPPPPDPPSPPDDEPTPRASSTSSTRSTDPVPPQPVFTRRTTRSRSEQGRDHVWLETNLCAVRVSKLTVISCLSSESYTFSELPSSALATVVHSTGQPIDTTSSRDRVLIDIAYALTQAEELWPLGFDTGDCRAELVDEALRVLGRSVLVDVSPDSITCVPPRLHPFLGQLSNPLDTADNISASFSPADPPRRSPAYLHLRQDPTPAHIPLLRDIAASLWLERPEVTDADRRAGFAWRQRRREDAEADLAGWNTELREDLLFPPDIEWKYRQKLFNEWS
ncbi:hypothetical protein JCM10296v2_004923 [Rhodotorula toruloides]